MKDRLPEQALPGTHSRIIAYRLPTHRETIIARSFSEDIATTCKIANSKNTLQNKTYLL